MLVYHVSRYPSVEAVKEFIPRIPWSAADDEDTETPRICVSSDIVGAMAAIMLDDDIVSGNRGFMVYSANVDTENVLTPEELVYYHGVYDAMQTNEYWITVPTIMHGHMYKLLSYWRDNYILPKTNREAEIREYFSQFEGYDDGMSLHVLLNEFAQKLDLDESDLTGKFGLCGIRIFSRVVLEAL